MGERVVRILISIFFLLMIFFVFSGIIKKCTSGDTTVDAAKDALENVVSDSDNDNEYFEDNSDNPDDYEDYTDTSNENDELSDQLFEESTPSTTEESDYQYEENPAEENTTRESSNNTSYASTSSSGRYLVISGNYLILDNAQKMVNRLRGLGYDESNYFTFDESRYYTVTAIRTNDYDAAQSIANDLKQRGIDNYVHTVK